MTLATRVGTLVSELPDDDPAKQLLRRRAVALADECGCAMGGAFLVAAFVLAAARLATAGVDAGAAAGAMAFVLAASIAGKAVGIGVAKAQLVWLHRVVAGRLATAEVNRVDVH